MVYFQMAASLVAATEARRSKGVLPFSVHGGGGGSRVVKRRKLISKVSFQEGSGIQWNLGVAAVKKNLDSAIAASTSKSYAFWWGKFEVFCSESGVEALGASVDTVMVFLSNLAEGAAGQGGVKVARAALHHYFELGCRRSSPTDDHRVTKLIMGIERRFGTPVRKSAALSRRELQALLRCVCKGGRFEEVGFCHLRLAAQVVLLCSSFLILCVISGVFDVLHVCKVRGGERSEG